MAVRALRPSASRLLAGVATAALVLVGLTVAPQAAQAAPGTPVPEGVYLNSTWVEPGGRVLFWWVGEPTQCRSDSDKSVSFVSGSTTTPLQQAGAGGSYFLGMDFALVDENFDPLPLGESGPVSGTVVLTCTPFGGGTAQSLSFPLTVRATPPATIYHSPTAWTWYANPDGTVATVNALGFKPGESVKVSLVNSELVTGEDFSGATSGPVTAIADGAGAVTTTVPIPSGWADDDLVDLMIAGAQSRYLLISGQGSSIEGDATLTVDSSQATFPGGALRVTASGYVAGETVQLALHRSSGAAISLGTLPADGAGRVNGVVSLPSSVPTGSYRLWAGAKVINYLLLNTSVTVGAKPAADRVAGADRFATAAAISAENFEPGVETVFLANGLNFPDALSAGAIAARIGAPVLLTAPGSLPATVKAELQRLQPDRIVIVGGTPSVSAAVENAVSALSFDPEVDRVAGADRFATNRLLIADAVSHGMPAPTSFYISTGFNFPDALAAAPAAAYNGGVVVLVNGNATALDSATVQMIQGYPSGPIAIIGGPTTVSSQIENQLKGIRPGLVQRLAGVDRFETAALIVDDTWESAPSAILASGVNFPDALAASALGQPMLTSLPTCVPGSVLAQLGALLPGAVTLIGDGNALSSAVANFTRCS